jgi:hypothetical protein
MKIWIPPITALLLFGCFESGRTQPTADDEAIRKVIADANAAWERHDMKAWAQQFAVDADFVNVTGTHWRGRMRLNAPTCNYIRRYSKLQRHGAQAYTSSLSAPM